MPKADFKHSLRKLTPESFFVDEEQVKRRTQYGVVDSAMKLYSIPPKSGWFRDGKDLIDYITGHAKEMFNMRKGSGWNVDVVFLTQDIGKYVPLAKGFEQNIRKKSLDALAQKCPMGDDFVIDYSKDTIDDEAIPIPPEYVEKVEKFDPERDDISELLGLDKDISNFRAILARRDIRTLAVMQIGKMIRSHIKLPVGKVLVLDGDLTDNENKAPVALVGTGGEPDAYTIYQWKTTIGEADLRIMQICNEYIVDIHSARMTGKSASDYIKEIGVKNVREEEFLETTTTTTTTTTARHAVGPNVEEIKINLRGGYDDDDDEYDDDARPAKTLKQSTLFTAAASRVDTATPTIMAAIEDTDFLIINLLQYSQRRIPSQNPTTLSFVNDIIMKIGKIQVDSGGAEEKKYKRKTTAKKVDEYVDINRAIRRVYGELSRSEEIVVVDLDGGDDKSPDLTNKFVSREVVTSRLYTFAMCGTLKGNDYNTPIPNVNMDNFLMTYLNYHQEIGHMFKSLSSDLRHEIDSLIQRATSTIVGDSEISTAFATGSSIIHNMFIESTALSNAIASFSEQCASVNPWNVFIREPPSCGSHGLSFASTIEKHVLHMISFKKLIEQFPVYEVFRKIIKYAYFKRYESGLRTEKRITRPINITMDELREHVREHTKKSPDLRVPSEQHLVLLYKRLLYTYWYWCTYDTSILHLDEFQCGFSLRNPEIGIKKSNVCFSTPDAVL